MSDLTERMDLIGEIGQEINRLSKSLKEANLFVRQQNEIQRLNDRINQLESVVNDPHALWTNWLRGDVKLPAGIGDVRQYQDRIKRLEEAGDALYENSDPTRWDSLQAANRKLNDQEAWRKAKEVGQ